MSIPHPSQAAYQRFVPYWTAAVALVCALGALIFCNDFGIGWNEGIQAEYGRRVLRYFASGGHDLSCMAYLNTRFHGPLFDMLGAMVSSGDTAEDFARRHFLTALFGGVTALGVITFTRVFYRRVNTIMATLAILLNPVFIGHSFFNPKDLPFACAFTWLAVALLGVVRSPGWRSQLFLATMLGLTCGLRFGGLPLVLALIAATMGFLAWRVFLHDRVPLAPPGVGRVLGVLCVLVLGWVIAVLPWPWAHEAPLRHPMEAVSMALRRPLPVPVVFAGQSIAGVELPRTYLLRLLLITTPVSTLLLALGGLFSAWRGLRRASRVVACARVIAAVWVVLPIAGFAIARPNVYDGTRHFLFILPGIAVLAGVGAERVLAHIAVTKVRAILGTVLGALLFLPLITIIRLHPYEYAYFNALAGGHAAASQRYDSDYWLLSYREAAIWLNGHDRTRGQHPRVLSYMDPTNCHSLKAFLDPRFELVTTTDSPTSGDLPPGIDYYVGSPRSHMDAVFPDAETVKSIGRLGATYAIIKRRRGEIAGR